MATQTINDPINANTPQQFTTGDGTIQGAVDGTNAVFLLGVTLRRATIWRNGILMTQNLDCVFGGRGILFLASQIPQPGDIITVAGFPT